MSFTQEAVLTFLLERGGQVRSSDLVAHFRGELKSGGLKATFKRFVDTVAVVKEIDGIKHVVVRKTVCALLRQNSAAEKGEAESDYRALSSGPASAGAESDSPGEGGGPRYLGDSAEGALSSLRFVQNGRSSCAAGLALERSESAENPEGVAQGATLGAAESKWSTAPKGPCGASAGAPRKPCMLPLRIPPPQAEAEVTTSDLREELPKTSPEQNLHDSGRTEAEEVLGTHPPRMRNASTSVEHADKPRFSGNVPLEAKAHDWLVKSTVGQWGQVHGLLLLDAQLAEKRDFMSGFTALHWAVKAGNTHMVNTIIEVAKRAGMQVNVNSKSYGGYTPLHIAAIHGREDTIALLLNHYGADRNIRDNSGKKPGHYLRDHASPEVRQLLGPPRMPHQEIAPSSSEVNHLADLAKGFNTISKLLPAYAGGHWKKHKRPDLYFVSENPDDD